MIHQEFALRSMHHDIQFAVDARLQKEDVPKPVVIYIHGFKGFKDWGTFNAIAENFARSGYIFVKMNLSHNGTTLGHPQEFVDLEAFAMNTFSIELDDIGIVLDYIFSEGENRFYSHYDLNRVFLLGHSRGGTAAILKACEDKRVSAVATWSAVSDYPSRWSPEELQQWKEKGITYVLNTRTQQRMPLYYQFIEDYFQNRERLDLSIAIEKLDVSLLVVHAKDDNSVPVGMAYEIKDLYDAARLLILEEGGHTFGGSHPHLSEELPESLAHVVEETRAFFKETVK